LNRVDELIIFNPLSREDLARIVELQLAEVRKRLKDRGVTLELEQSAVELLIAKGHNEDFGARPLRRAIERLIEDPLSEQLLRTEAKPNTVIKISRQGEAEELTFTTIEAPAQPVAAGAQGQT
jgi:ATP-dependent Clp protease ATP-binding subunit ClpC